MLGIAYLALTVIALIIVAFFFGMAVMISGKSLLRTDRQNLFWKILCFLKDKSGYFACFGVGVALTLMLELSSSTPYILYRWAGLYDQALLGSLILDDESTMETGIIPEKILRWWAKYEEEGL